MASVAARLEAAGLSLPQPPVPVGAYVPAIRTGGFVFTSGQLPLVDGALVAVGAVGAQVSPEQAADCARVAALNALAAASLVCDLDQVEQVVKLVGYVACDPDFSSQPAIVNGASNVMSAAFGEAGAHAREAVGVAALPMGAPVEVSIVLKVR